MVQRLLAVLGAVAMVLVAVVVRGAIDDAGGGGGSGGSNGTLVVVCAHDLIDACKDLAGATVIDADAATTADQIQHGTLPKGVDAWLTTSVWTEVVAARSPGRVDGQTAIASSPVVVAVDPSRTAALRSLCGAASLWRCIGDATGNDWGTLGGDVRWGSLRVGLPSASSATGLGVLASVASGFFGNTAFARNDFDNTTFPDWLDALTAPSDRGEPEPVGTLLTARGRYTAVGDVAAAATGRDVDVLTPSPALDVTVVLATFPGGDHVGDVDVIRKALVARGWTARSGSAVAPTLQVSGVLAALHALWADVTR